MPELIPFGEFCSTAPSNVRPPRIALRTPGGLNPTVPTIEGEGTVRGNDWVASAEVPLVAVMVRGQFWVVFGAGVLVRVAVPSPLSVNRHRCIGSGLDRVVGLHCGSHSFGSCAA